MSRGVMSLLQHLNEGVGDGHPREALFAAVRAGLRVATQASQERQVQVKLVHQPYTLPEKTESVIASLPSPPSITQAKPVANQHPPRCSRKEPLSLNHACLSGASK